MCLQYFYLQIYYLFQQIIEYYRLQTNTIILYYNNDVPYKNIT